MVSCSLSRRPRPGRGTPDAREARRHRASVVETVLAQPLGRQRVILQNDAATGARFILWERVPT
jgi:hypothetical protein